jgi:hypothetical protein
MTKARDYPLYFNKEVFNKIIDNKSFINNPTVKMNLKNLVENLSEELENKTEYY